MGAWGGLLLIKTLQIHNMKASTSSTKHSAKAGGGFMEKPTDIPVCIQEGESAGFLPSQLEDSGTTLAWLQLICQSVIWDRDQPTNSRVPQANV